ncbi:MAG: hypothetical protein COC06_06780 [Bacteroidales bacterium]|nr:MAG: hypothetical protein COC06_06780 [Bacteroidales bacterium]
MIRLVKLCFLVSVLNIFIFSPAAAKTTLKFNNKGKFKIVQFTDMHFRCNTPKSKLVLQMMNEVLDTEKPDLVIFTGDIVSSDTLLKGWNIVTKPLIDRAIPWAVTIGNHDDEHDKKREEILPLIEKFPYNQTKVGPKSVYGYGNYTLSVKSANSNIDAFLLYCMDSNNYSTIKGIKGYGWFRNSQINWYKQTSDSFTKKNNGTPMSSLAFFHIPLFEYIEAWEKNQLNPIGVKNEKVCSPKINTGMYACMLQQGDIMGTFVGHDHDNNYVAPLHNIALVYGRFSGGDTYGKLINGARVIELEEGKREFTTWVRLRGGEKIDLYKFVKDGLDEKE